MASGKHAENDDTQDNPSYVSNTNENTRPMIYDLMAAVQRGKETKLRNLLARVVNINERDHTGKHAFAHACSIGNLRFVQILHISGSDINLPDNNHASSIILAAANGHEAVVEYLCRAEADVNAQEHGGTSALHVAVAKSAAVSKVLLRYGADVNLRDRHKDTPLHVATRANNEETVKLLLAKGADLTLKNLDKQTPSKMAKHCGYYNIVKAIELAKYERKKFPSEYIAEKNSFTSKVFSIFKLSRKKDLNVNIEENPTKANKSSHNMSTLKVSDRVICTTFIESNKEQNEVELQNSLATQDSELHYSTFPIPRKNTLDQLKTLGTHVQHLAPDVSCLEQGNSDQFHVDDSSVVVDRRKLQANQAAASATFPGSQLFGQHQSRPNSSYVARNINHSTLSAKNVSNNEKYYSLPRRKMSVQPKTMSVVSHTAISSLFSDLPQGQFSNSDLNMPTYEYSAPPITQRNKTQLVQAPIIASETNTHLPLSGIPAYSLMESPPLNYVLSPQSSYQTPGMYQVNQRPPRPTPGVHAVHSDPTLPSQYVQRWNTVMLTSQPPEIIPLRMQTETPDTLSTFQPDQQILLGPFLNSAVLVPFTPQPHLSIHTAIPSGLCVRALYNAVTSSEHKLLNNQNDLSPYTNIHREVSNCCLQQMNPVFYALPVSPQKQHTSPLETSRTQHTDISIETPAPDSVGQTSIGTQRDHVLPHPNEELSENSTRRSTDSSTRDEDTDDYSVLPPAYQECDDTSLKISSDRSPPPLPPRPAKDIVSPILSTCHQSLGRSIGEIHKHLQNQTSNCKLSELNSSQKRYTREKINNDMSSTGSESGFKDLIFEEYFDECKTYNNIRIEHNVVIQNAEVVAAGEGSISIQQQSSSSAFSSETEGLQSYSDSQFSSRAEASQESSEFEINQSLPSNEQF